MMVNHGSKILLGWILVAAVICIYLLHYAQTVPQDGKVPLLLVISFDGFRWDYLSRTHTPHFDTIVRHGVYARKGLQNVFPTSTLTNHWSMVTGLYAESHGIIENEFFDPILNKSYVPLYRNKSIQNDYRFYDTGAEPIWLTNIVQNENGRSGTVMWWGAENMVKGIRPTHHMPYDLSVDEKVKIHKVLEWFTSEKPINLGLLYFSEPDKTAHKTGPDSENVTKMIARADELTGYLMSQLKERNLLERMNLIITSDHGFASVSRDRLIFLDDFISPEWYRMTHYSPVATIIPHPGKEDILFEKLLEASKSQPFSVYKKKDIPTRLHYKENQRVTPIIAVADVTYSFISKMPKEKFILAGGHGYDNKYLDMRPFFLAQGPSFKRNCSVETFSLVDLYPLMCHLLHLKPAPNNGSIDSVSQLLADHSGNFAERQFMCAQYLIVLSCAILFLLVFRMWRHPRYLRNTLEHLRSVKFTTSGMNNIPQDKDWYPLMSVEVDKARGY